MILYLKKKKASWFFLILLLTTIVSSKSIYFLLFFTANRKIKQIIFFFEKNTALIFNRFSIKSYLQYSYRIKNWIVFVSVYEELTGRQNSNNNETSDTPRVLKNMYISTNNQLKQSKSREKKILKKKFHSETRGFRITWAFHFFFLLSCLKKNRNGNEKKNSTNAICYGVNTNVMQLQNMIRKMKFKSESNVRNKEIYIHSATFSTYRVYDTFKMFDGWLSGVSTCSLNISVSFFGFDCFAFSKLTTTTTKISIFSLFLKIDSDLCAVLNFKTTRMDMCGSHEKTVKFQTSVCFRKIENSV